ncbi:MAG: ABC transporter permease [Acidobacteria bacterium]|nr:ABC transporter permease [Acidobacteriota bacterium]
MVDRRSWIVGTVRRFGPLLGLLILSAVLSVVSPYFLTWDNILNIFRQSAVNGLLALGQLLVILTAGIDLSVGSILGLSTVVFAMTVKSGWPTGVAFAAALSCGLALGLINGFLLTGLKLPHPFVSTLGMMNVARGGAMLLSGGFPIPDLPPSARYPGAGSVAGIPAPVVVMLATCGVFAFLLRQTVFGRDVYAIGGNPEASRLAGIPVAARLNAVYGLSGLLAGLAALLLAGRMNAGFPLAGAGAELDSIAAVIIGGASFFGGVGTVFGTLIGALIIAVLRNGLNLLNVSSHWQMIVIGTVIIWAVWVDVLRRRGAR